MPTGKQIPAAAIRRVWLDERLTTAQAAAEVGLTRANLWRRAMALGLPPRKNGRRFEIMDTERFARMWNAGVHGPAMGGLLGAIISVVNNAARASGAGSNVQTAPAAAPPSGSPSSVPPSSIVRS